MKLTLMKLLESSPKISEIQSRLTKENFLSRNNLPGYLDGCVFLSLLHTKSYPDRSKHPHFYHWYILMRQFAISTIRSWVQKRLYFNADDALVQDTISFSSPPSPTATRSPPGQESCSRSECASEVNEVQYIIEIMLKECSQEQAVEQLRHCLQGMRVEIDCCSSSREVRVRCVEPAQRQEVIDTIQRNLEYANLQMKRSRPTRMPLGQTLPSPKHSQSNKIIQM